MQNIYKSRKNLKNTGLKDCNGRLIYEGDIVKYSSCDNCYVPYERRAYIRYFNGQWWASEEKTFCGNDKCICGNWNLFDCIQQTEDFTVVGSIYDERLWKKFINLVMSWFKA